MRTGFMRTHVADGIWASRAWRNAALSLAVSLTVGVLPARGQQPYTPAGGYAPKSVTQPVAPAQTAQPPVLVEAGAETSYDEGPYWEVYFRTGPVFTLGGGFLERAVQTGWTFHFGLHEPFWSPRPSLVVFHEAGGAYTFNRGERIPVVSQGFFQGQDPPDDHVHFLQNGVLVAGQEGSGDFITSRLEELHRLGFQYNLGASFYPTALNERADRDLHFTVRGGFRIGWMDADYDTQLFPQIAEGIAAHFGHGHKSVFMSTFGGKDPHWFIGVFGSVGAHFTWRDVSLLFRSTDVTVGVEVEFTHDWMSLGDYRRGDHGLSTISPLVNFALAF